MNTSFLSDLEYVKQVKETISSTMTEYKKDENVDSSLLWEVIKMKIRESTISFSKYRKKTDALKRKSLEDRIKLLKQQYDHNPSSDLQEKLQEEKKLLENYIAYQTKGAITRSKARWYNEGERNSKYFLSLEKRNFQRKTITKLVRDDKTELSSNSEILNEMEVFYKNLYSSQILDIHEDYGDFFPDDLPKIPEHIKQSDSLINERECLEALKSMENGKSPGIDGFLAEFYKVFWSDISSVFMNMVNCCYDKGEMSISQKRGLFITIPKKDKNPLYLKNWRPISLLNVDYKIIAKVTASRVRNVLPSIISGDQTGFLKDRFIGENIRTIFDLIDYTQEKQLPGLLLFLDFEKAFDSLEWSFLFNSLRKFNFGDITIRWIQALYSNAQAAVSNNGWISKFFSISRGVRQGCPLSPYLFIICAEILAHSVRKNPNIKCVSWEGRPVNILMYADDTTIILDGSKDSLKQTISMLNAFAVFSGLKINIDKTEAMFIGSLLGSPPLDLGTDCKLKWTKGPVKALGTWFSTDPTERGNLNFNHRIKQLKEILHCWSLRRLTLLGKILVIKSLAFPILTYNLSTLPIPCSRVLKEIKTLLFQFLWDNKNDKVKRTVIVNDYIDGGLKMVDIDCFVKANKISWIFRYINSNNNAHWKIAFDRELKDLGGDNFWNLFFLKKKDLKFLNISNKFVLDVITAWCDLINFELNSCRNNFLEQPLWLNSNIRVDKQPIFYKRWVDSGVLYIGDLFCEGQFMSFQQFLCTYSIKTHFLEFLSVKSAVISAQKALLDTVNDSAILPKDIMTYLRAKSRVSRLIYSILLSSISTTPAQSQAKWARDSDLEINKVNWAQFYSSPFRFFPDSKSRIFH